MKKGKTSSHITRMTRQDIDAQSGELRAYLETGGDVIAFMNKQGIQKDSEAAHEVLYFLLYRLAGNKTLKDIVIASITKIIEFAYVTKNYSKFNESAETQTFLVDFLCDIIKIDSKEWQTIARLMICKGFRIECNLGENITNVLELILAHHYLHRIFHRTILIIC